MHELFSSNVFAFTYDYDEWPTTHTDPETYIRPYNGSIFHLRNEYRTIFHEDRFKAIKDNEDSSKVFKVNYSINLLPQIGIHNDFCVDSNQYVLVQPDDVLMELFKDSEEFDIFNTESL